MTSLKVVVGKLSAIPLGEGREFEIGGELIAVFRPRSGGVYATQARCPHKEGPLADGLVGGTVVSCPFHAWKFDLATGNHSDGTCRLKTYQVEVQEDESIVLVLGG